MTERMVSVPSVMTREMHYDADRALANAQSHGLSIMDTAAKIWDAALTAAPVREEGGAVSENPLAGWTPHDGVWGEPPALAPETLVHVLRRNGNVAGPYRVGHIEWHHQNADSDPLFYRPAAALATREEAPAEAGEDAIKAACIAWHRAKGSDPFNVLYNGAWCGSFPHQTGPERWTFAVPAMKEAIAAYLRAQPPAREDAQPVAYDVHRVKKGDEVWIRAKVTDPCTSCCGVAVKTNTGEVHRYISPADVHAHPAPDALREDSQAWGMLADLVSWFTKPVQGQNGMVWVIPAGDQGADDAVAAALAALQAEQEGGA